MLNTVILSPAIAPIVGVGGILVSTIYLDSTNVDINSGVLLVTYLV